MPDGVVVDATPGADGSATPSSESGGCSCQAGPDVSGPAPGPAPEGEGKKDDDDNIIDAEFKKKD